MNIPSLLAIVFVMPLISVIFVLFFASGKDSKQKGCFSTILTIVFLIVFFIIGGNWDIATRLHRSEVRTVLIDTTVFMVIFILFTLLFYIDGLPKRIHQMIKNFNVVLQPVLFLIGLFFLFVIYRQGPELGFAVSLALGILLGTFSGSTLRKIISD